MDPQHIQQADNGDVESQYKLARQLEKSLRFKEALVYYTKSAKQGYPKSFFRVSQMYKAGRGVAFNIKKSAGFMKLSADNGYVKAQYFYGRMLYYGLGVEQNLSTAIDYFGSAANSGYKEAQIVIGKMLAKGEGLDQDINQAAGYLYAASEVNAEAKYKLGKILMKHPELNADPEQYLKDAAEMGHIKAKYYYGMLLSKKDQQKSFELIKEAAESNYTKAQYEYGAKLYNSQQDEIEGLKNLRMASVKGSQEAHAILDSVVVDDHIEIPNNDITGSDIKIPGIQDDDEVIEDDLLGTNIQIPGVQCDETDVPLNITIMKPTDNASNEDENSYLFIKSKADEGDPEAQFIVGKMLFEGDGVDSDAELARTYLKKSADQGNENARVLYESIKNI